MNKNKMVVFIYGFLLINVNNIIKYNRPAKCLRFVTVIKRVLRQGCFLLVVNGVYNLVIMH